MKSFRFILASFLIMIFVSSSFAQRRAPSKEDIEKFKAKKVSFITEKLQLTPKEAQEFWPVYNQFEKENWDAQGERRKIERKIQDINGNGNLSDKEIIKLTQQMIKTYQDETDLKEKYNIMFLEILPPPKVLKLYQAERQFKMEMLQQFRNRRSENK